MSDITARCFYCQNCGCQVFICSSCDRGNVYCKSCSKIMRKKRLKESNQRYQNTLKGGINHARRQKEYREREIVTHRGSKKHSDCVLLSSSKNNKITKMAGTRTSKISCSFCVKNCSAFLRQDFLRRRSGNKNRCNSSSWPCGP